MNKNVLLPYERWFGETVLTVERADVDGQGLPGRHINENSRTVNLTGASDDWETAAIQLSVQCPDDALDSTRPWGRTSAILVTIHCQYSNGRQSVLLRPDDANPRVWRGELILDKENWFQRGLVSATAFATVDGIPHRIVAKTLPWTIGFDPMSDFIQTSGALPVKWIDFTDPEEDGLEFLQRFSGDPWFLDLDPLNPRLLLNRAVKDLAPLLSDSRGISPAQRAAKVLIEGGVAAKIWDAFFAASIEAVAIDDETGDPIEPSEEWQSTVLRILLRRMYPDHDHVDALREAVQSRRGESAASMQQLLAIAVDQQAKIAKGIRDAAQLLITADTD